MRSKLRTTRKLRHTCDLPALRQWLREELSTHAGAPCVADVVVATQEAVTNSLRSNGTRRRPVKVRLDIDGDYVWVEVVDSGGGLGSAALLGGDQRARLAAHALPDGCARDLVAPARRVRMGKRLAV